MARREKKRLGDLLVQSGVISEDELGVALAEQKSTGKRLGKAIIDLGLLKEEEMIEVLADQLKISYVDLQEVEINLDLLKLIPENLARKHTLIPIEKNNGVVKVAMADPLNVFAMDEIAIKMGMEVQPAIGTENQILAAIQQYYGVTTSIYDAMRTFGDVEDQGPAGTATQEALDQARDALTMAPEAAPIAKLVDVIIAQAVQDKASDIHIEPDETKTRVRYRIDGILFEATAPPKKLESAIISRVKIMSKMDIAETRTPQDGRFQVQVGNRDVEFRVSTFPTIYGENVVIRILNPQETMMKIGDVGLSDTLIPKFQEVLAKPHGMTVVTGPTGSGKTTTLYASLNELNTPDKNILTIEDPVEFRLEYIRQAQVNVKAGLTFAAGLRAMLRQDPDIIMIGEIRDLETAEIAVQSAMTGHMVLSTMHTNDAPSAVVRLIDLGIEPFLISSSVAGVIAQRLVRKICSKCKERVPPDDVTIEFKNIPPEKVVLYHGTGCLNCKKSGYLGRIGIFELLILDEEMKRMVIERQGSFEIKRYAVSQGMRTIREDGLIKALKGITSLEEIKRVSFEDE